MTDKSIFARITNRIETSVDDMIEMQIALTSIPALSPENGGDGEHEKAKLLMTYLKKFGFPEIYDFNAPDDRVSTGIRPNIIARIPGKNTGKTVWILTHMDIVPPGEPGLWSSDPYAAYVKDGKIYGRGTEDNQQDLTASLFAAKAFIDEGITPESNIGLVFVADEETSSLRGLGYVLGHDNNPFLKTDLIVVPDSGDEEGAMVEIAEKSMLWLRFKTQGKQCHGSRPELGKNAFLAASHLVVKLNDLHKIFNASDPLYSPSASTFQPTRKDSNVPNVNTIPGEDIFYIDCRILPEYDLTDIMAEIRHMADSVEKQFGVTIEIMPVQMIQAPSPTPPDAPAVRAVQKAVSEVYRLNAKPAGIGAGTVAALFRAKDYYAAVWSKVTHMAHQPDEYCVINNMVGNAKVFAHLFLQK